MDRDTLSLETPVKKSQVVYYSYLTGREYEYIQTPLFQAMPISGSSTGDVKMGQVDVSKIQESTHRLLEKLIKSIDGKTEGLVDVILDMPQKDYQFVIDELNALSKKNQ